MPRSKIEQQARYLARKNREADPSITGIYWFPSNEEVRLVEIVPNIPPSGDSVEVFYFRSDSAHQLPAPSGIALVRPDEFGAKPLPEEWGDWDDGVEIGEAHEDQD